ncbi:MAG: YggT family protein [Deltaproteobacteria bacterium]
MFILSNLLNSIATLIDFVLSAYMWIVSGRAVISWVNPDPYNPIVRFLREITDPVLDRIRRFIPLFGGGIDFTPVILILLLLFLRSFLVPTLHHMAAAIG